MNRTPRPTMELALPSPPLTHGMNRAADRIAAMPGVAQAVNSAPAFGSADHGPFDSFASIRVSTLVQASGPGTSLLVQAAVTVTAAATAFDGKQTTIGVLWGVGSAYGHAQWFTCALMADPPLAPLPPSTTYAAAAAKPDPRHRPRRVRRVVIFPDPVRGARTDRIISTLETARKQGDAVAVVSKDGLLSLLSDGGFLGVIGSDGLYHRLPAAVLVANVRHAALEAKYSIPWCHQLALQMDAVRAAAKAKRCLEQAVPGTSTGRAWAPITLVTQVAMEEAAAASGGKNFVGIRASVGPNNWHVLTPAEAEGHTGHRSQMGPLLEAVRGMAGVQFLVLEGASVTGTTAATFGLDDTNVEMYQKLLAIAEDIRNGRRTPPLDAILASLYDEEDEPVFDVGRDSLLMARADREARAIGSTEKLHERRIGGDKGVVIKFLTRLEEIVEMKKSGRPFTVESGIAPLVQRRLDALLAAASSAPDPADRRTAFQAYESLVYALQQIENAGAQACWMYERAFASNDRALIKLVRLAHVPFPFVLGTAPTAQVQTSARLCETPAALMRIGGTAGSGHAGEERYEGRLPRGGLRTIAHQAIVHARTAAAQRGGAFDLSRAILEAARVALEAVKRARLARSGERQPVAPMQGAVNGRLVPPPAAAAAAAFEDENESDYDEDREATALDEQLEDEGFAGDGGGAAAASSAAAALTPSALGILAILQSACPSFPSICRGPAFCMRCVNKGRLKAEQPRVIVLETSGPAAALLSALRAVAGPVIVEREGQKPMVVLNAVFKGGSSVATGNIAILGQRTGAEDWGAAIHQDGPNVLRPPTKMFLPLEVVRAAQTLDDLILNAAALQKLFLEPEFVLDHRDVVRQAMQGWMNALPLMKRAVAAAGGLGVVMAEIEAGRPSPVPFPRRAFWLAEISFPERNLPLIRLLLGVATDAEALEACRAARRDVWQAAKALAVSEGNPVVAAMVDGYE